MIRKTHIALISALLLGASATVALAAKPLENDAMAINNAKVSLTQAIATAEQHAGGKAVKAELDHGKKGSRYEVEVANGGKVFDVQIDDQTGAVLASVEDKADHDHDDEQD